MMLRLSMFQMFLRVLHGSRKGICCWTGARTGLNYHVSFADGFRISRSKEYELSAWTWNLGSKDGYVFFFKRSQQRKTIG